MGHILRQDDNWQLSGISVFPHSANPFLGNKAPCKRMKVRMGLWLIDQGKIFLPTHIIYYSLCSISDYVLRAVGFTVSSEVPEQRQGWQVAQRQPAADCTAALTLNGLTARAPASLPTAPRVWTCGISVEGIVLVTCYMQMGAGVQGGGTCSAASARRSQNHSPWGNIILLASSSRRMVLSKACQSSRVLPSASK